MLSSEGQHSNRWIKVSEDLPEYNKNLIIETEPNLKTQPFLIKIVRRQLFVDYSVNTIHLNLNEWVNFWNWTSFNNNQVIERKFIEQKKLLNVNHILKTKYIFTKLNFYFNIMKKIILLTLTCLSVFINLYAQNLSTARIDDWNKIYQSGFYESDVSLSQNNPPDNNGWFWGINTAHSINNINYKFNGQIVFRVNINPNTIPIVFIRSTNQQGEGIWAKLLHSKGDHAIDGKLTAKEIEIKVNTGADFVFKPDYNLKSLSEVENFVKKNQHLPDIPSEKDMQENGLNVNEMQIKLLQKIEELTLYVIGQQKEIEGLKQKLKELE